jgi:hypothetical protein
MSQKITFLFGSGISFRAGMPSVSQITDKIISGDGIMRHSNGVYYFGPLLPAPVGFPDEYIPRVTEFLNRLRDEIKQYYISDPNRKVNYEDLFYVAAQVYDSEVGECDNPIVQAFIDKIMPDINLLLSGRNNEIRREWKLHEIAVEATHYIYDIVWHSLNIEPASLDYMRCLGDACQDAEISSVNLFTLNHDTVIERYLEHCKIRYTEGFGLPINGVHYWSLTVRLFWKLVRRFGSLIFREITD